MQALLAYAAAVLWALAGVVVSQYDASLLTTGAALPSVAPVVALVGVLRRKTAAHRN